MKWWRWIGDNALFLVIAGALAAGLAASYGRELEAQRQPDRGWWARRLLIMPLLAIAATAATDLFELKPSIAAFSAAMLSLGGYDVLRLLEAKWRHRAGLQPGTISINRNQSGHGGSDELSSRE